MGKVTRVPGTTDSSRQRRKSLEVKLWMAVLQRAIFDAFASPGKGGATVRDAVEAQNWLTRGGDNLAVACEAINIDPGMVQTWAADMAAESWPRYRFTIWTRIAREMKRGDKL